MIWLLAMTLATAQPSAETPAETIVPGFLEASQLVVFCRADEPDGRTQRALCLGYVAGAVDEALARQARRPRPTICVPPELTPDAIADEVVALAGPPAHMRPMAAAGLVHATLEARYPCPVSAPAQR